MSENETRKKQVECVNIDTLIEGEHDGDPRVYLVIVPVDENRFAAKPLILPKKVYQHVMLALTEANKLMADDPDPANPSVTTAMKVAEILSRQFMDDGTIRSNDDEMRQKSVSPRELCYFQ